MTCEACNRCLGQKSIYIRGAIKTVCPHCEGKGYREYKARGVQEPIVADLSQHNSLDQKSEVMSDADIGETRRGRPRRINA